MDGSKHYALSTQAAVRREPFGGLVYRYDNRRLYFVHSKPMVEFLERLDGSKALDESIDGFLKERALPAAHKPTFLNAMAQLEKLEVLREL